MIQIGFMRALRGNIPRRGCAQNRVPGAEEQNHPAQSHGLESQKISGRRRSVFLDFSFYRTYRDLAAGPDSWYACGKMLLDVTLVIRIYVTPESLSCLWIQLDPLGHML